MLLVGDIVWLGDGVRLCESTSKGGNPVIEGVFQKSDCPNQNKRTYPRALWERVLTPTSPAMKKLADRQMVGHLEHPSDGKTVLTKVSHLITHLELLENGDVFGRAELLNTPDGKTAQELVRGGVKIGISSRGAGKLASGGLVEASTYVLDTFDLVYNPSTQGAHPTLVEGITDDAPNGGSNMTFAELERKARSYLSENVSNYTAVQLGDLTESALNTARELIAASANDPASTAVAKHLSDKLLERREEWMATTPLTEDKKTPASGKTPASDGAGNAPANAPDKPSLSEEAEKAITEATATIKDQAARLKAAEALIEELKGRINKQKKELSESDYGKAATALVNQHLANEEARRLDAMREAAIAANPRLEKLRKQLDKCLTESELEEMVADLNEAVGTDAPTGKKGGKEPKTPLSETYTLPTGRKVDGSAQDATKPVNESADESNLSAGAKMARRMMMG